MRIYASTIGLVACAFGFARAEEEEEEDNDLWLRTRNTSVAFPTGYWHAPGIFYNKEQIVYNIASGVHLTAAFLRNQNDVAVASATSQVSAQATATSVSASATGASSSAGTNTGTSTEPFEIQLVDWGHGLNGNNTWAQGSILFDLSGYKDDYEHAGAILTPLYLQLAWESSAGSTRDLRSGSTYSSLFVLNENGSELSDSLTKELTDANGQDSGEWTPYKTECYDPGCPTDSGASTTSSEVAAQPTSTGAASSAAATTSTASSTPESGSSGLNTGAIAGIAVACAIVGLALLGAAVWFLCFRRRRNSHGALHQNNGYASDGMGPGVMADKELPHVTDSPHSAYAPDRSLHAPHNLARNSVGGAGAAAGVGVGTGLMEGAGHVTHAGEDSYAPYSDHTPPPGVVGADRGPASSQTSLPAGGTNSPTPISNRYAHLVEEGMTDDEIRRLEEEERALDMAIEDHGRSSRAQ